MAPEVPIPPSPIQSSVGGLQLSPTWKSIHYTYSSGPSFSRSHSPNKMWAQISSWNKTVVFLTMAPHLWFSQPWSLASSVSPCESLSDIQGLPLVWSPPHVQITLSKSPLNPLNSCCLFFWNCQCDASLTLLLGGRTWVLRPHDTKLCKDRVQSFLEEGKSFRKLDLVHGT